MTIISLTERLTKKSAKASRSVLSKRPDLPPLETGKYYEYEKETDAIHYKPAGLNYFRPLFARAGINISTVKTGQAHIAAEDASEPYLFEYLAEKQGGEDLLLSGFGQILLSNYDGLDKTKSKIQRRKKFEVV